MVNIFSGDLLSYLILTIIMTVILLIYLYKQKYRIHSWFVLAGILFALIGVIIATLDSYLIIEEEIEFTIFLSISNLILSISYYFLYLHYDALSSLRSPFMRHAPIFGLVIVSSSTISFNLVGFIPLLETVQIVGIITATIGVIAFYYSFKTAFIPFRIQESNESLLEFLALVALFIAALVELVREILELFFENPLFGFVNIFHQILYIVGLMLLFIIFLYYDASLFRIPVIIREIIIYNNQGMMVYSRNIRTPGTEYYPLKKELLSGIFNVIDAILLESLGKGVKLKSIDVSTNKIIFRRIVDKDRNKSYGTLAVITTYETKLLSKTLKFLERNLPIEIKEKINAKFLNLRDVENYMDIFLGEAFPFLKITSKNLVNAKSNDLE